MACYLFDWQMHYLLWQPNHEYNIVLFGRRPSCQGSLYPAKLLHFHFNWQTEAALPDTLDTPRQYVLVVCCSLSI